MFFNTITIKPDNIYTFIHDPFDPMLKIPSELFSLHEKYDFSINCFSGSKIDIKLAPEYVMSFLDDLYEYNLIKNDLCQNFKNLVKNHPFFIDNLRDEGTKKTVTIVNDKTSYLKKLTLVTVEINGKAEVKDIFVSINSVNGGLPKHCFLEKPFDSKKLLHFYK